MPWYSWIFMGSARRRRPRCQAVSGRIEFSMVRCTKTDASVALSPRRPRARRGGSPRRKSRGRPESASAWRARPRRRPAALRRTCAPRPRAHARLAGVKRSAACGVQGGAVLRQFLLDAAVAEARRARVHARLDEARFAQVHVGREPVEQGVDFGAGVGVGVGVARRREASRSASRRLGPRLAARADAAACAAARCGCVRAAPATASRAPSATAAAALP